MSFEAAWMDLEVIILGEVCQTEKDKYYMVSFICGISKFDTNHIIYKIEVIYKKEAVLCMNSVKKKGSIVFSTFI